MSPYGLIFYTGKCLHIWAYVDKDVANVYIYGHMSTSMCQYTYRNVDISRHGCSSFYCNIESIQCIHMLLIDIGAVTCTGSRRHAFSMPCIGDGGGRPSSVMFLGVASVGGHSHGHPASLIGVGSLWEDIDPRSPEHLVVRGGWLWLIWVVRWTT